MQKTKIPRKGLRFDRYLSLISTTSFLIIFLKISLTTLIKGDLIEAALILKYSSGFKQLTTEIQDLMPYVKKLNVIQLQNSDYKKVVNQLTEMAGKRRHRQISEAVNPFPKCGVLKGSLNKNEPTVTHKIFETNSCEIAHNGKSLISVFQELSANINKNLILAGRLRTRLSFYEVQTISWYLYIYPAIQLYVCIWCVCV